MTVAKQSATPIASQVRGSDHDESDLVEGKLTVSYSVVASPLLPAVHTADGLAPVEEWGRLVVLALPVLDYKGLIGVVGVDRKASAYA